MLPKAPGTSGSGHIQLRLTGQSRRRSQWHLLDQYARQVPEAPLGFQPSLIVISAFHGVPCIPQHLSNIGHNGHALILQLLGQEVILVVDGDISSMRKAEGQIPEGLLDEHGSQSANTQLQERFSPELNRRAGEWMARLTGGKYAAVSLTRELEAAALERDSVLPRRSLALSRGTVDQLYLAVRLAVCQLCLPGEDPAPLVLDDALVTFDDRRMALALDALAELGRERQILLFTCQEREGNYLEGRPGVTRTALRGGGT